MNDGIHYLNEAETRYACELFDPVAVVRRALTMHGRDETMLPAGARLRWRGPDGAIARSTNMLASLAGADPGDQVVGAQITNESAGYVARGLPSPSGLTALFDPLTARITCLMSSAQLSVLRTACVTVAAAQEFVRADVVTVGMIGAGMIAQIHLELIARAMPQVSHIAVYDNDRRRCTDLVERMSEPLRLGGTSLSVADSVQEAVLGANLAVPTTMTTTGYLRYEQLAEGAVIVNVSLNDVLPDVVRRADLLFVDDWSLVHDDQHRLLSRMARAGQVVGPREQPRPGARRVDAELGQVLAGVHPGRTDRRQMILVTPFGTALEDLALAAEVQRIATEHDLGRYLVR